VAYGGSLFGGQKNKKTKGGAIIKKEKRVRVNINENKLQYH
jgi:hypothetical protein